MADQDTITTLDQDVPPGYVRYDGGKRDIYHYRTAQLIHGLYLCTNTNCDGQRDGRVDIQVRQTLSGGDSIKFNLQVIATWYMAPSGFGYGLTFKYFCGIRVPDGANLLCRSGDTTATSSGTQTWQMANGTYRVSTTEKIFPSFGRGHAKRVKFPMIRSYFWWEGREPIEPIKGSQPFKIRLWDICRYTSTSRCHDGTGPWKLNPVSGFGPT